MADPARPVTPVDGTPEARRTEPEGDASLGAVLVMAALGAATVARGAYHRSGQVLTGALLCGAVLAGLRGWRRRPPAATRPFRPLVLVAALAGWTVVSAAASGNIGAAVPTVLLLAGCVVAALLCRGAGDAAVVGLLVLGALVALSGVAGVAWRMEPWALEGRGVWQAATTLAYANAAAGLLVPLVLVGVTRLVLQPASAPTAAATCVLLVGLGATLSRGGILALVVGASVLARRTGIRPLAAAVKGPATGAGVALAALLPSMIAARRPVPGLAVVGLAFGVLVAVWSVRAGRPRMPAVAVGAVLVAVACVMGISGVAGEALSAGRQTRLTLSSADRVEEARAAVRVGAAHPVTGAGPGRAVLSWREPDGTELVAAYAHNEYLQTFAELGAVGLVLVLALVASIGRAARRGFAGPSELCRAGAAAGLAALAVHSALDFLWHLPAVPLLAAVLVGLSCPAADP